jgi:hypothetical protein
MSAPMYRNFLIEKRDGFAIIASDDGAQISVLPKCLWALRAVFVGSHCSVPDRES